jgi:hypothetical protein
MATESLGPEGLSVEALAAATPDTRDRYVDFLRAFSIVVVVAGHWFIALIHWDEGRIFVDNVVGHQSGLWLATWALQVMPLFFFVGGFSNSRGWHSVRSGHSYRFFMRRRLTRLFKPTAVFIAVWLVVEVGLHLLDIGAPGLFRGTFLPFGPLWFLLVYVALVALTPLTLALHQRWGFGAVGFLVGAVVVVEVLRFGFGIGWIGWLNLGLVWLAIHQAGYFYADGSLLNAGPRRWWRMVLIGLLGLVVLTNLDLVTADLWYPRSMVGVDIEPVSNMSPPSLAILFLACWQIGAAMLARASANRWLQRPAVWAGTVYVNSIIMTLFLWHLTAFVIVILVLYPLGFGHPVDATARWWLERVAWVTAPAVLLAGFIWVFGRFERPGLRPSPTPTSTE